MLGSTNMRLLLKMPPLTVIRTRPTSLQGQRQHSCPYCSSCSSNIPVSKKPATAYSSHPSLTPAPDNSKVREARRVLFGQPSPSSHPHLLQRDEVLPLIKKSEFKERRNKLMSSIMTHSNAQASQQDIHQHLVVIPSASKMYMSGKIPYPFRQNTDFLYLTGCKENDCALVLSSVVDRGNSISSTSSYLATLFVNEHDGQSELWDGPRTGVEGAVDLFGIDQALSIQELSYFMESFARGVGTFLLWYDFQNPPSQTVNKSVSSVVSLMAHRQIETPNFFIQRLRWVKSPSEIELMKQTCRIGSEAISSTIASTSSHREESHLYAKVDYECRMRGAYQLAYPPVVASGHRANIIHNIRNDQRLSDGEIVLMDAGSDYHGYVSDITRCWPVSGKFLPAQAELYEALLSVQKALINQFAKQHISLDTLFSNMCSMLGTVLQELLILPKSLSGQDLNRATYRLCPHHVGHYLGMDVHDTSLIPRSIPVQPGVVITVEPGIYINEKTTSVPEEFRGIGIRIEDDVLITESGPLVLTESCPKEVDEIEQLMRKEKSPETNRSQFP